MTSSIIKYAFADKSAASAVGDKAAKTKNDTD